MLITIRIMGMLITIRIMGMVILICLSIFTPLFTRLNIVPQQLPFAITISSTIFCIVLVSYLLFVSLRGLLFIEATLQNTPSNPNTMTTQTQQTISTHGRIPAMAKKWN